MSCEKDKRENVLHVVRRFIRSAGALLAVGTALLASPSAFAVDSGDIVVVSSKGEVHITVNGAERKVRAGGALELPASVRTGRDGSLELKQGATTVSVGPETLLDFPALEKRGAPIDRIVQPRGNAFYNIGKREGRKLRVETPYLVGVIKGTQFNVAAHESSTTISLFEGLLEVRAADDSDVVDLSAGETASLKQGDKSISVLKMDAGKAPTNSRPAATSSNLNGSAPNLDAPRVKLPSVEDTTVAGRGPIDVRTDVEVNADVVRPGESQVATNVGVDAGSVTADLATSTRVDLGAGTVDTGLIVGASAPQVDVVVGVDAAVDAAAGTVDVGLDVAGTNIDVGVDTADTVETVTETVTDTVTDTVDTAGGLLDTLTRQPGRK